MTCTKPPPNADQPEDEGEELAEFSPPRAEAGTFAEDEDEVLPAYTPEALEARVRAQQAFLREDSLFEDAEGNPLAPNLEAEETEGVGSVEDDILLALPGSAGFGLDGGGLGVGGEDAANGNALGLYVPIEEPREGPALAHFYNELRELAAGEDEDGKVRILVYGGSHTQADVYPGYIRTYLQTRFGDGGPGFVSFNKVNRWFRYQDWLIDESGDWKCEHAQRSSARKDGYYGLLGASGAGDSRRCRTKVYPRHEDAAASHYELFFLRQPEGGTFKLYVDGERVAKVDTEAEDYGPGYHSFELDEAAGHELEVRLLGDGEVRLFGVVMERDQPGVVVDTLGISGTRAANMLKWDAAIWTDQIRRRDPDLWTMFYGTNEATDEDQPISAYRADLREVIARFQAAAPEASCLLIGPGDFPRELEEDVWVPRPRLVQIVEVQRDLAYEMGCGFWDTLAFMGGVNSMHTWATSRPQMASRDHIHFTKRGYVRMGMAVTDAIMARFDRGLASAAP